MPTTHDGPRRRDARRLLFVEPTRPATAEALVDEYTRRMAGAWHRRVSPGPMKYVRAMRGCVCRMSRPGVNLLVHATTGMLTTNALCVHYLAHHRDEVPPSELAKVLTLLGEPEDPRAEDLQRDLRPLPLPG